MKKRQTPNEFHTTTSQNAAAEVHRNNQSNDLYANDNRPQSKKIDQLQLLINKNSENGISQFSVKTKSNNGLSDSVLQLEDGDDKDKEDPEAEIDGLLKLTKSKRLDHRARVKELVEKLNGKSHFSDLLISAIKKATGSQTYKIIFIEVQNSLVESDSDEIEENTNRRGGGPIPNLEKGQGQGFKAGKGSLWHVHYDHVKYHNSPRIDFSKGKQEVLRLLKEQATGMYGSNFESNDQKRQEATNDKYFICLSWIQENL